ncbi:MAG: penicillin-insensitive murein endopeptidase [Gammaproteobacteria bacterium HGW-Gammaproteobacteria-3]|nr:MAG: penicillin-insensitive murein endopeptidase [Gammaproteobacteria bacterium HGW-Gammaproteobacteria-3]
MKQFLPLLLMLSFSLPGFAASSAKLWTQVTEPADSGGMAQSIGGYSAGCLSGAVKLPVDGEGYQAMRLSRQRLYGHPDLIRFIEKMGAEAAARGWGELLIGDLGQPRGGPTLSGHRSHQTGLDVDIWYLLSPQAAQRTLTFEEREQWGAPSVLAAKSDNINFSQWLPAHEQLLEIAARSPEVERIFVNPGIKRQLCRRETGRDWLNKIRPWWQHDDHFHVRLKCPENSPYCENQEAIPPGDGCDASLAWWFSSEARTPAPRKTPALEPKLPIQCERVLNQ